MLEARVLSGRRNINVVAVEADPIGAQVLARRTRQAAAAGDVELGRVQRALDHAVLDESLAEDCEFVGAHVIDGHDAAVDAVEGDRRVVQHDGKALAVAQVGRGRNPIPRGQAAAPPAYSAATRCAAAANSS